MRRKSFGCFLLRLSNRNHDAVPHGTVNLLIVENVYTLVFAMARGKEPAAIGELQFHVAVGPKCHQPNYSGYQIPRAAVEYQPHHDALVPWRAELTGNRSVLEGYRVRTGGAILPNDTGPCR
jgi:hypothetical protein